ncbi:winged helix DNA-binding domain-containing protein [Propionibacteriaceae bacterium Y1923]
MPDAALGRARLLAQGLVTRPHASPQQAVSAFVAMQGQDLPGVISSVALRTASGSSDDVLDALNAGDLVRGYPMRGTVFLMAREDVLWVSELCNAGALQAAVNRRSDLGLDEDLVERARQEALTVLPEHETGLSRSDLFARWEALGVPTDKGRGYHVLAHLIGRGDLVHGPWNGTDQNIVSSAQWIGPGHDLEARFNGDQMAATADLLGRYLASHGPASHQDFAWWTKLPLRDIRAAWPLISADFESGTDEEGVERHWRPGLLSEVQAERAALRKPLLLPGFDEFILGYKDRLFALTPEQHQLLVPGNNGVFGRSLVIDGTVRGLWKRGGRPGRRTLELAEFAPLAKAHAATVRRRFSEFPFHAD